MLQKTRAWSTFSVSFANLSAFCQLEIQPCRCFSFLVVNISYMDAGAITSEAGVFVFKDRDHAVAKDCRSLFALDNLKQQSRSKKSKLKGKNDELHTVPYPVNYYGDITGPCELKLMKRSSNKIDNFVHNDLDIEFTTPHVSRTRPSTSTTASQHHQVQHSESYSFNPAQYEKVLQAPLTILHISHYSFEWALRVNDTIFTGLNIPKCASNYHYFFLRFSET